MIITGIVVIVVLAVLGLALWLGVDAFREDGEREREFQEMQAARRARWGEPTE